VTYVELLLVVTVALVLSVAVLPTARTVRRRAQEKELKRALTTIREAIDEYHRDWEHGYIESDQEDGWPEDLEELNRGVEYDENRLGLPGKQPTGGSGPGRYGTNKGAEDFEPFDKVYLKTIPKDPFNLHDDPWDVSGWKARQYDDEHDSTSWGGESVYDVRSSSTRTALDGTLYEEW
jgi:general secretion pathway protein G